MFSIWRRGQLGTQRRCADEHRIARAVQTSSQLLPLCLLTKSYPPPQTVLSCRAPVMLILQTGCSCILTCTTP